MNTSKVVLIASSLVLFAALRTGGAIEEHVVPLNRFEDSGKFTYYSNEELVGRSHFRWDSDGSFHNIISLDLAGQTIGMTLEIDAEADGCWTSIAMNNPSGLVTIERDGCVLEIVHGKRTGSVRVDPGTYIMEDMGPALLSQAVIFYDRTKGGVQRFPLFFIPGAKIEGSLEYVESCERNAAGELRTFDKYLYSMPGIYNVVILVDAQNRVCLAEYPDIHGVFVREGYEVLNVRAPSDDLLSKAEHEVVVEANVGVPMRDSVELATAIYRPDGEGPFPTILVRTPYKKELVDLQARFYARRGYVFAVQDVRGRFGSPGEWVPFVHEADDGFDTIEWLAEQPWSNGKVGMIGGSYLGWVQWWAASRHPPHLVTMIPNVSPPAPYFNFPCEQGALFLATALWWASVVEKEMTADLTGLSLRESFELMDRGKLDHLPVIELDEIILGEKNSYWREWLAHPDYDDYWRSIGFMDAMKEMNIPVYHQSGWFDGDGIGSKLNYAGMVAHGHQYQKLVLGPWGHTDRDTRFGPHGIDWGPEAVIDLQRSYLRWMDRWLKGIDNGIDEEPLVSLFVMGSNDWLHGRTYPLEGTLLTPFYLASEGDADSFDGKGILSREPPGAALSFPDQFVYDPGDPTPSDPKGRKDLLVYRTPPADEAWTFAGPISAVLHAASSARDTDWVMRLAKIDAKGRPLQVGQGVIRARHRESFSTPRLLEPGRVYEYRIDLWQAAVTIEKGEHLVLVVSSALFPRYSRNLNLGGNNETGRDYVSAEQTIYHDVDHPSHLVLPVIAEPKFAQSRKRRS